MTIRQKKLGQRVANAKAAVTLPHLASRFRMPNSGACSGNGTRTASAHPRAAILPTRFSPEQSVRHPGRSVLRFEI